MQFLANNIHANQPVYQSVLDMKFLPTPPPTPIHYHQHNPSAYFIVISIHRPPPQHLDTDNNPHSNDKHLHHLANLYQIYQNHATPNSGVTLIYMDKPAKGDIKQLILGLGVEPSHDLSTIGDDTEQNYQKYNASSLP